MNDSIKLMADFMARTKGMGAVDGLSWRLVKDGHVWDYSAHPEDIVRWWNKIRAEEPDAVLSVEASTWEEMYAWKSGDFV